MPRWKEPPPHADPLKRKVNPRIASGDTQLKSLCAVNSPMDESRAGPVHATKYTLRS